jgi:ribosomal protein L40E
MEGYKTFIQAMDDASDHCSVWENLEDKSICLYNELMEAAFFIDGLSPLPDNLWWVAFEDGTVGLLDDNTDEIMIMYVPVASPPVYEKYTGEDLEREMNEFFEQLEKEEDSAPAFCMYCGARLPEGAEFCMKCGSPVRR